ncbi:MAG TPA: Uma2 family endonuclease [Ktedonobacteraceae bacterium]
MAIQHNIHDERVSFEEYFATLKKDPEHRYEYLDGHVYMMTGGSPDHSIIGSNANGILRELVRGRGCIVYNSDVYFQVSEKYRVCPDVTVSCDPRDRGAQDAIRYPSLVVEVLSPATEARDRGEKSLQYRSCPSIQEILLVSAQFPIIELFRREKHGFWTLYTLRLGDTVELTSLGVRFSVTDVYQDTSLLEKPNE